MSRKLERLPTDAPAGTLVLVVEDDRTITYTRTRSQPWALERALAPVRRGDAASATTVWVVQLAYRHGGYALSRCFLPPTLDPDIAPDSEGRA